MKTPLLILVSLIAIAGIAVAVVKNRSNEEASPPEPAAQSPTSESAVEPTPTPTPAPTLFYPMTSYSSRTSERTYGEYFTADNPGNIACGGRFTGYHNGDDLEVNTAELAPEIPVFAVADGEVLQLRTVSGYGGLLTIRHTIDGQVVTANYGHVDATEPKVSPGAQVKAGQLIANLGAHCSTETDGERKHLHFSLHKGPDIDVKGYAATQAELSEWLNPTELLSRLKASEPKP